jgi:hypothetical protein
MNDTPTPGAKPERFRRFAEESGVGGLISLYAHSALETWFNLPLPGTADSGEWTAQTWAVVVAAGGILAGIGRGISWCYRTWKAK